MKTIIIGGGIAGMAMAIYLRKNGMEVVLNERGGEQSNKGNAFLMHAEGVSILKELSDCNDLSHIPGRYIDRFSLKSETNHEIKYQKLDPWQCMKRSDIVEALSNLLPEDFVKFNREFSHFIYRQAQPVAAVFKNGDIEFGDIFIGADGGNSKVREALFGETSFTKTEVKEVLGLLKSKELCERLGTSFTKFQHETQSINFGVIPSSDEDLVWYIQYNPAILDIKEETKDAIENLCKELLKDFPELVQEVMSLENFENTYIWHTKDFDLLPSFHRNNVVLIGDAAHLALPFTSAGTTNAMVDAHTLCSLLISYPEDPQTAFRRYYQLRAENIAKQIQLGRSIKKDFLNPLLRDEDETAIPLITKQERAIRIPAKRKDINIIYFTDPICSTCWIIQPQLRKLQMEFGNDVNIEYKMGGLLPSWENYNRYGITQPSEVAAHWESVCSFYEMPVNKQIWLEDPLPSSYPPSIAFKAAQLQDTGKAVLFLRRIREMVFLEKKNIIKKDHLYTAAYDVGLDAARLIRDLEGKAQNLFRLDLMKAEELEVKVLPTLFFSNKEGVELALNGYQPYENFVDILKQLKPDIQKLDYNKSPEILFDQFQTLTTREFSLLRDESEFESLYILNELLVLDQVKQYQSPTGDMWISNFSRTEELLYA